MKRDSIVVMALAASAWGCHSEPPLPIPERAGGAVWIDADPAIGLPFKDVDDGYALVHALYRYPNSIRGISLGHGNTNDLDYQEEVTRALIANYSANTGFPVTRGAEKPGHFDDSAAARAIRQALAEEELTFLALGRLTTIAQVLAHDSSLAKKAKELVILGGNRAEGRPTFGPQAIVFPDSNLEGDFDAVEALMATSVPIALIATELTAQVTLTASDLDALAARGNAGAYLAKASRPWLELSTVFVQEPGFHPFDLMVTAYADDALRPYFRCEAMLAQVVRGPDPSFKRRPGELRALVVSPTFTNGRPVRYCSGLRDDAKRHMLARLVP
ncbi:MAG: nucleoside hydrolase [Polyangiaceae bacterium]